MACRARARLKGRDDIGTALLRASLWITGSSTSTEEAIQNHVPVILYDPWRRNNHLKAPELNANIAADRLRSVVYVSDSASLKAATSMILRQRMVRGTVSRESRQAYIYDAVLC
jgi:hypothetical protein